MAYGPRRKIDPVERILARIEVDTAGCWLLPPNDGQGRTRISVYVDGVKVQRYSYRIMWESQHGPVPEGMELDHLCRVTNCCNPVHVEPVTHLENCRRGARPRVNQTCKRGHLVVGENAVPRVRKGRLYDECRECANLVRRERRQLTGER